MGSDPIEYPHPSAPEDRLPHQRISENFSLSPCILWRASGKNSGHTYVIWPTPSMLQISSSLNTKVDSPQGEQGRQFIIRISRRIRGYIRNGGRLGIGGFQSVSFYEKKTYVKSLLELFLSKGQCHQNLLIRQPTPICLRPTLRSVKLLNPNLPD
jgi:hypothetical protein